MYLKVAQLSGSASIISPPPPTITSTHISAAEAQSASPASNVLTSLTSFQILFVAAGCVLTLVIFMTVIINVTCRARRKGA